MIKPEFRIHNLRNFKVAEDKFAVLTIKTTSKEDADSILAWLRFAGADNEPVFTIVGDDYAENLFGKAIEKRRNPNPYIDPKIGGEYYWEVHIMLLLVDFMDFANFLRNNHISISRAEYLGDFSKEDFEAIMAGDIQ